MSKNENKSKTQFINFWAQRRTNSNAVGCSGTGRIYNWSKERLFKMSKKTYASETNTHTASPTCICLKLLFRTRFKSEALLWKKFDIFSLLMSCKSDPLWIRPIVPLPKTFQIFFLKIFWSRLWWYEWINSHNINNKTTTTTATTATKTTATCLASEKL